MAVEDLGRHEVVSVAVVEADVDGTRGKRTLGAEMIVHFGKRQDRPVTRQLTRVLLEFADPREVRGAIVVAVPSVDDPVVHERAHVAPCLHRSPESRL